jgi:hypothetical protein
VRRGGKGERRREQRLEFDLPAPLSALGALASALLPHISLLHGWLVLAQLSLPSSPDDDTGDDGRPAQEEE